MMNTYIEVIEQKYAKILSECPRCERCHRTDEIFIKLIEQMKFMEISSFFDSEGNKSKSNSSRVKSAKKYLKEANFLLASFKKISEV